MTMTTVNVNFTPFTAPITGCVPVVGPNWGPGMGSVGETVMI